MPLPRSACAAAILAAIAAIGASCSDERSDKAGGARDKETTRSLTLAAYAQPDPDEFVDAVERLSDGSLRVRSTILWRDGQVDYERATVGDVRQGRVDLALVGARVFDVLGVTGFQGLLAPFLVDSLDLQRRVLESPLAEEMLAPVNSTDVVGIGLLPGDLRRPVGFSRRLGRLPDYRGVELGVRPSALVERTFRALGGTTRPALFPRDLTVVDGTDYDATGLDFTRYDKAAQSIGADVVLWPRTLVLIGNRDALAKLTDEQRRVLRRAVAEALAPAFERIEANEASAVRAVCSRGDVELVYTSLADRSALRSAVRSIYGELRRDALTRKVIDSIESMKHGGAPDVLSCDRSRASPPSTGDAGMLDGTWQWSVSRRRLLAAGATPAGSDRNRGRWRLVLRNGHFVLRNLRFGDEYRGTYSLSGDRLLARVDGTPADATNEYRWSLYRDRLSLDPVEGKPFAAQVVVTPLIRTGAAADRP